VGSSVHYRRFVLLSGRFLKKMKISKKFKNCDGIVIVCRWE
jgi:hypothetical protein